MMELLEDYNEQNLPHLQVDDRGQFDRIDESIDSNDYTGADWEVKKYDPQTNGWKRKAKIPISDAAKTEDLKEMIARQKWGGPGTYSITLYCNDIQVEKASKVRFIIEDIDKQITNVSNENAHYILPTGDKEADAVDRELQKAQVESLRDMRIKKQMIDLDKQITPEKYEKKENTNDLFAIMMQMNQQQQLQQQQFQQRQEELQLRLQQQREEQKREDDKWQRERDLRQQELNLQMQKMQMDQQRQSQEMLLAIMNRKDPTQELFMQKMLQDKPDPLANAIPTFMAQFSDAQNKIQQTTFEILKKNIDKEHIVTQAEENIKVISAINQEVVQPAIQALISMRQGQSNFTTAQQPQAPVENPPKREEPKQPQIEQNPDLAKVESVVQSVAKMIEQGKKGEDVWQHLADNLNENQMEILFIDNGDQIDGILNTFKAAGYPAIDYLIEKKKEYIEGKQ